MLNTLFKRFFPDRNNEDDKPKQVKRAVILLYAAFILAMLTNWMDGINLVPFVISFLVVSFLIFAISERRKWARIIIIILLLFNLLSFAFNIAQLLNHSAVESLTNTVMVLYVVEIILEIYAVILLFSKPANIWFNTPRPAVFEE